jgi:hypothetical protein
MANSVEVKASLPWELACEVACFALIWRCSFEQAINVMILKYRGVMGDGDGRDSGTA